MKQRLRILASPAFSNAKSNRYQSELYGEIAKSQDVAEMFISPRGLLTALSRRADILHVHWLERAFWGRSQAKILPQVFWSVLTILILKARGTRFVWTAHDPVPHDMAENRKLQAGFYRVLWRLYRRLLVGSLNGVILLTETHLPVLRREYPCLATVPHVVTPHPHYRGIYPNSISPADARNRLELPADALVFAFVGKIRPYKNVDGLLRAFLEYQDPRARLLIAGEADTGAYGHELEQLAKSDARVKFVPSFVPDDQLQLYLNASNIVVFPFREVTNSGSVLLALSFDRPVAVVDAPVFRELQAKTGSDWIRFLGNPLSPADFSALVSWCNGRAVASSAPLTEFGWERIAAQTIGFYRRVLGEGTAAVDPAS